MLTPGNKKIGAKLIWGFGLPSADPAVCVGASALCRGVCYGRQVEARRPNVLGRYRKNLALSRRADFATRLRFFLEEHRVEVVRVHTGGDVYSAAYARKWLAVMRRLRGVRFYLYTRSWRLPAIAAVLADMAALANVRVWYSCDRETGVPADVPPRVRLAWMMTEPDEPPPPGTSLVFRVRKLRRIPLTRVDGVRVCPEEDGVARRQPVTCDRCKLCWSPDTYPPAPGRAQLTARDRHNQE